MAYRLNESAAQHAKRLINKGDFEYDERDDWSEHAPTSDEENDFIDKHGYGEYAKWHLGENSEHGEETKARYTFPYGDFRKVHRGAIQAAKVRASQNDHGDIGRATDELDELMSRKHGAK